MVESFENYRGSVRLIEYLSTQDDYVVEKKYNDIVKLVESDVKNGNEPNGKEIRMNSRVENWKNKKMLI